MLFYHSLYQAVKGLPQQGPLQVAVRGLQKPMQIFNSVAEVRAYRWEGGRVWPKFPLDKCQTTALSWAGFRADIPANHAVIIDELYGASLALPDSKYAPPLSVPPEKQQAKVDQPKPGVPLDCGVIGTGDNFSDQVTVYWLNGKHDVNAESSMASLKAQDCRFRLVKLTGYRPLVSALNAMMDCETPFWVQCDNDMVLYSNAIRTLLTLAQSRPDQPLQVCHLHDVLSNRSVQGIKIYNKDVWGPEPWEDVPMPTPHRLKKLAVPYGTHATVLGEHSPVWTDRAKFDRAADLANITSVRAYDWIQQDMKTNTDPAVQAGYAWGRQNLRATSKGASSGYASAAKQLGYLKIGHVVDQYGWAFDHIARELASYSRHAMFSYRAADLEQDCDIVHSHGLGSGIDVFPGNRSYTSIGQYSGLCTHRYTGADYEFSISPHINAAFGHPANLHHVREGIDTYYWVPSAKLETEFKVGWSGRNHKVKRPWLLDQLCVPVDRKSDWGGKFFVPNRDRVDQLDFYHRISCLVMTSESECQPRVILEAMACGLPIIATRVGRIPDMIDADWCVDVSENACVSQINERIDFLKSNPEKAAKLGMRNRLLAERLWSWTVLAPIWDDLYEAVARRDEAALQACIARFSAL